MAKAAKGKAAVAKPVKEKAFTKKAAVAAKVVKEKVQVPPKKVSVAKEIPAVKEAAVQPETTQTYARTGYEPSEMVIREMMVNKNVSREQAISILKNPSK